MESGKILFLHVGEHKTGTSAVQHFCRNNDKLLESKGIYYTKTGGNNLVAQHRLASSIMKSPSEDALPEKSFEDYCGDLQKDFSDHSRVLISTEYFSDNIDHGKLPLFKEIASEVKIIIYLRRQDTFLESYYSHGVKCGYKKDIISFCDTSNPDWYSYCAGWKEIFGEENIIVRSYEKQQLHGGTIFSDFLSLFGLELTDEYYVPDFVINPSLSRDLMEYLLNCNICFQRRLRSFENPLVKMSIEKGKNSGFQKHNFLSPAKRIEIIERFAESNSKVAREYLGRKDGRLFYDPLPDPNEPWEPYPGLSEEDVLEITKLIAEQSPNLIPVLMNGIFKGLMSDQPNVKKAADKLMPALRLNKNLLDRLKDLQKDIEEEKEIEKFKKQNKALQRKLKVIQEENEKDIQSLTKLQEEVELLRNRLSQQSKMIHHLQTGFKYKTRVIKDIWIVKRSGLFDEEWYLRSYPDVDVSGIDPVKHYITYGWREGRDPSPDFRTEAYLTRHPDLVDMGVCPLVHSILHGKREELFSTK